LIPIATYICFDKFDSLQTPYCARRVWSES